MRDRIKGTRFDEAFALQAFPNLSPSFDFIADVLANSPADFYAIPGRGDAVSVAVDTKKVDEDYYRIRGVFVGSVNVLRPESKDYDVDSASLMYRRLERDALEKLLSEELVVPTKLLHVDFNPVKAAKADIGVPYGWTVRKALQN